MYVPERSTPKVEVVICRRWSSGMVITIDSSIAVNCELPSCWICHLKALFRLVGRKVLQVDIWGLGACCMEMAEKFPPYKTYPPLKAMFRTASRGAPPLKYPHKWSSKFKAFLSKCFTMSPEKRPSAEQLMEVI